MLNRFYFISDVVPPFHVEIKLAATLRGSRPGVQSASLYDNFCKTRNDVIFDVIIWVQDGNCKKMTRENFSIGALYNITKN